MSAIDERTYRRLSGVVDGLAGGQELIYAEIAAALLGSTRIWFPFATSPKLLMALPEIKAVAVRTELVLGWPRGADAVYFGTPTIVDGRPLFPVAGKWDKARERESASVICRLAELNSARVVCGLGSGDVSLEERLEDMGEGARVICYKDFGEFQDWVLVR